MDLGEVTNEEIRQTERNNTKLSCIKYFLDTILASGTALALSTVVAAELTSSQSEVNRNYVLLMTCATFLRTYAGVVYKANQEAMNELRSA